MAKGLRLAVFLLSLYAGVTLSSTVPSNEANSNDYLSITQVPEGHWDDVDSVVYPLVRIEHHHIGKRDRHHELFAPSNEITLDYQYRSGIIQSFEFEHDSNVYVNLEPLQTHGLLLDRRQLCVGMDAENKTVLNLDFKDNESYNLARTHWEKRARLLFVVEDDSCHEDERLRSVYRADEMSFDNQALSIHIIALNKKFPPFDLDTAKKVFIHTGPLNALKKRHLERRFYVTPRIRRGINGIGDGIEDIGDGIEDATNGIINPEDLPGIPDIKKFGEEKLHDLLTELQNLTQFHFHHDLNWKFEENFDGKHDANQSRVDLTEDARKYLSVIPQITLINTYAKVNLDFSFGVSFSIIPDTTKGLSGGFGEYLENSIQDAYVEMEALEDIDVSVQAEVMFKGGPMLYCAVWLWPVLGSWSCVGGVTTANLLSTFPIPGLKDPKAPAPKTPFNNQNNKIGTGGFTWGFTAGLAVWGSFSVTSNLNITTPGFKMTIPKGSVAGYGRKDGAKYHDKFDGEIEWTKPKFHTQDLEGKFSIAIGPSAGLSFGAGTPLTFSLYARADMPGLDFKVATIGDVDEKCEKDGPFKRALGFWMDLKVGPFAGITLPLLPTAGLNIDTSWIKTGVKGMVGLEYVVNILAVCWDITNTKLGQWEQGIEDRLNKERHSVADAAPDSFSNGTSEQEPSLNGGAGTQPSDTLPSDPFYASPSASPSTSLSSTPDYKLFPSGWPATDTITSHSATDSETTEAGMDTSSVSETTEAGMDTSSDSE